MHVMPMALFCFAALCCAACDKASDLPKEAPIAPPATKRLEAKRAGLALEFKGEGPLRVTKPELLASHAQMKVRKQWWQIGERQGVIWYVEMPRMAGLAVLPSDHVKPLREFSPNVQKGVPYAVLNGGFYERVENSLNYRAMGVVRAAGKDHGKYTVRGGSGVVVWDQERGGRVIHRKAWKTLEPKPTEALQSIDRLVDKGKSLVNPKPNARMTARTAVAFSKDAVWFVLSTSEEGVSKESQGRVQLSKTSYTGMTLGEFALYLVQELGAWQALNVDGSVSSQMMVKMDQFQLEIEGERGTINALVGSGQVAAAKR